MSKPRAAALLGGLAMVGVLVLSSLVGAQQSYFQQLKGALGRACLQHTTENVDDDFRDIFRAACSFTSVTLQELPPGEGDLEDRVGLREALLAGFAEAPGLGTAPSPPTVDSCDECLAAIQPFESFLATNGTADGIRDAVEAACRKKFTETPQIDQCLETVAETPIPQLIDFVLANYPPLTVCEGLQFCPAPSVSPSR